MRPMKIVPYFLLLLIGCLPGTSWALASNNIPLDSPVYLYLEKLAGLGLITSDVKGLRPFSRSEAARLLSEAESNLNESGRADGGAGQLFRRLRDLLPREASLREESRKAPFLDYNLFSAARLRYVNLNGVPRSYVRDVHDPGHQSAFGFIGGDLRPFDGLVHTTGTEGTPLLPNNEGVIYQKGNNGDLLWEMDGWISDKVAANLAPDFLYTPDSTSLRLQRGYVKVGGGGLELELGRDANWFGPGFRGTTTLTNNAKNFDLVKLSSPEPIDVGWLKRYVGDVKYALMVSRFDETGTVADLRRPYLLGAKLAVKPKPWLEAGFNFIRQFGGPGFSGSSSVRETFFGGGDNDHANTIAGFDVRFRIPWLANTEVFGEYSGEDSAGFWPIVESYVAGVFVPCLFGSPADDFRFEYFWGSVMLYGDWQFPAGYVYHNMTPGHSQGGAAQEFFFRYSHWFSVRNVMALEYIRTDRGRVGRLPGQELELRNAVRGFWSLPLFGDWDVATMYGWEYVDNFNLVPGSTQTNQLFKLDLSYRY